jgi:hypothetical protein
MNYDVLVVGAGPTAMAADTGQMESRYGTPPATRLPRSWKNQFSGWQKADAT